MATKGGGVYFPVDAGFCDTQAARQVRRRFGAEGFEAYVRLLCMLLREDGGRLSVELDDDWADIADQLGMPDAEARELVAVLAHYKALVIDREAGCIWAPLVSDGIAARKEISEKRRAAGKASGEARRRKKQEQEAAANDGEEG